MFFFSSRRRHTRLQGDWSSDVCSSDLAVAFHRLLMPDGSTLRLDQFLGLNQIGDAGLRDKVNQHYWSTFGGAAAVGRSEERRVGKEYRGGGGWRPCVVEEERSSDIDD